MKKILKVLIMIILVMGTITSLRSLIGGFEDDWICKNGQWVKHGHPSRPSPTMSCNGKKNDCQNISEEKAIDLVKQKPEVKDFLNKSQKANQKVIFKTEKDGNQKSWLVQVAEDFPDHLATFNWYQVDFCIEGTNPVIY
jgi:hypothetical protein